MCIAVLHLAHLGEFVGPQRRGIHRIHEGSPHPRLLQLVHPRDGGACRQAGRRAGRRANSAGSVRGSKRDARLPAGQPPTNPSALPSPPQQPAATHLLATTPCPSRGLQDEQTQIPGDPARRLSSSARQHTTAHDSAAPRRRTSFHIIARRDGTSAGARRHRQQPTWVLARLQNHLG